MVLVFRVRGIGFWGFWLMTFARKLLFRTTLVFRCWLSAQTLEPINMLTPQPKTQTVSCIHAGFWDAVEVVKSYTTLGYCLLVCVLFVFRAGSSKIYRDLQKRDLKKRSFPYLLSGVEGVSGFPFRGL